MTGSSCGLDGSGGIVPSTNVDTIPTPTAEQLTSTPRLENSAGSYSAVSAPTPITSSKAAGYIGAVSPLLPAAATITTLGLSRLICLTARSSATGAVPSIAGTPTDVLMTSRTPS